MKTKTLRATDRVKLSKNQSFTVFQDGLGTDGKILGPAAWFRLPAGAMVKNTDDGIATVGLSYRTTINAATIKQVMDSAPKSGADVLERTDFIRSRRKGSDGRDLLRKGTGCSFRGNPRPDRLIGKLFRMGAGRNALRCVVRTRTRKVFKAAILANAVAIVLAHNHPSGDPDPSSDDRAVTDRLSASGNVLGIKVLDSIVVTDDPARYRRIEVR